MKAMRYLLGLAFGSVGILHSINERQFRSIAPEYLSLRKIAVSVIGIFETFFGAILLTKGPADWLKKGINISLLAVLPVNIYMVGKQLPLGNKSVPKWALYLRLPLQFILIAIVKKL